MKVLVSAFQTPDAWLFAVIPVNITSNIKYSPILIFGRNGIGGYLLFFCLQLISSLSLAQQPYTLVHYDEDHLPQTSIGNIQQDKTGYLWMNSQYGIVRFDGETFKAYTTANLPGLTSNRIRLCVKGPDKSIWFVDENNTVIKVNAHNQFEALPQKEAAQKWGLGFFITEGNNDINFLKPGNMSYQKLISFLDYDPTKEALKSFATGIHQGYIFYVNRRQETEILYYENDHYLLRPPPVLFNPLHTFKLNNLVAAQVSSSEALLFNKNQIPKKVPITGLPRVFSPLFKQQSLIIFSHESGTFFYAGGKLYEYKFEDSVIAATLVFENLPCTGVVNVMKEKTTGDYFISTRSQGIYRVKKKRFSVISLVDSSHKSNPSNPERNNIIYSINFRDAQHIVANGNLTAAISGTKTSTLFTGVDNSVTNLFFSHKKDSTHLWINYKDSLQSFDTRTGRLTSLQQMSNVKKVIDLADGSRILLTTTQIFAWQNEHATPIYRNDSLRFSFMEKVSEQCLVVGSATGLYYFYPARKKLQHIPYEQTLHVRFIHKDRAGRLWITTYGSGLFHLSGRKLTPLPLDNAGHLAISHSILEDNSGNFWISTNHGLFKVAYSSLQSIVQGKSNKLFYNYFDKTDGFNTNEFNGGCYPSGLYQRETGAMFFPSMEGVVTFSPDSIKSVPSNNAVFFDEVLLNDTLVYALRNQAVFPPKTSSIRLFFSSPYYGQASNIRFSYSLSGAPDQWKDLGSNRMVDLNNLPGGDYTLTLRKEENAGSPVFTSFRFQIEKAFIETIWFKLLLLAMVTGLIFLYFKARLLYLGKERQRLEKEVAARTADQLQLINQLKKTIEHLTQLQHELSQMIDHKENIIAILIHDIKSPLYFLNTVSDHLTKNFTTNPPEKNREITKEIATSLNRLYLFTQDFAIWLNASEPSQLQSASKVDVPKIISESIAVYDEIIAKKGLTISRQVGVDFIYGDASMIKSIIRNLVDNGVKNTASGSIIVTAKTIAAADACEIRIADEGKGLTDAQLEELNYYLRSDQEILSFSSSQFGHKVIKDFIRKLNGTIYYQHNNPSGIAVTVTLPIGRELI